MRALVAVLAAAVALGEGRAWADSASCLELVRQGRAYEAAQDQDRALSRYGEAARVDSSCGEAYLAMGELRARMGDGREAERALTAGLERVPSLRAARLARAKVRRAMGNRADAEDDLRSMIDSYGAEEPAAVPLTLVALRTLAGWFGEDSAHPAQLATWRRIHAIATRVEDGRLTREASAMVRALTLVVGLADPVTAPPRADAFRKLVARAAHQ